MSCFSLLLDNYAEYKAMVVWVGLLLLRMDCLKLLGKKWLPVPNIYIKLYGIGQKYFNFCKNYLYQ